MDTSASDRQQQGPGWPHGLQLISLGSLLSLLPTLHVPLPFALGLAHIGTTPDTGATHSNQLPSQLPKSHEV